MTGARRRLSRLLVVALICIGLPAEVGSAQEPVPQAPLVLYAVPVVGASVVDPFRPPAHVGAPGNRGLEYGTTSGAVVSASAAGWVLFAGAVAGRSAITIQHDDGVRSTYTGLSEVFVVADQAVRQHSAIGVSSGPLHFGARLGDHYLDPQILIDASEPSRRPRLIPPPSGG